MFKNWKTSLAGLAALLTGVSQIVSGDVAAGVGTLVVALGLIAAADAPRPTTKP